MELLTHPTLADSICDIRTRKIKRTFFTQINILLDWNPIVSVIKTHYTKGKSATGKPSYSGLLLFKMSLLQTWYGLSDYEVEDRVNDSISFSYFCDLHIDQVAPDHSTLSRFRTMMTKAKAYEPLFKEINRQLEAHKIIVKTGAIIDASVIDTPLKPKGKTNHKVTEDRKDEQEVAATKDYADSVDKDAAWLKKSGKYRFGYKKHHVTDNEGLVLGVLTTKASTNEIANLEAVLDTSDLPKLNSLNSKLSLELAEQNFNGSAAILNSIKSEIDDASIKLENDSINFFRQQNLWKQHIGSKAQYDTEKLNYELATNHLKLLQSKYDRTKNELQTAVKQAQNNYQTALITTKDFTVKSKIDGKVYGLYKEPGEIVTTLEPLASIGSATYFIIELLVDEVDIVRISKYQNVLITLDAYKDRIFRGKVSKIYPKKDERNQTFKVEAIFDQPPKVLYPGLSGEANIVIAQKKKILTIPKSYILPDNQVKTDKGLVTITTGLQNMEYIEIISGITRDTYIYKPE